MATLPTIDAAMCERFVNASATACPKPVSETVGVPQPQPEWDALASSLAGIGLGVAWGGTVLAVIALIAGIAWAKLLRGVARQEAEVVAKEEARRIADASMKEWLAEVAPQIVSKHVQNILDAQIGDGDDALAADQIGEEA